MRRRLRRTLTYVTVLLLHGLMTEIPEAYVFDAIRTPRGRGKASGSLYEVKPVSLVVGLIDEIRARYPELDPTTIDDVVLGVVSPIGDQGGDIAKTAAIAAGLPAHRRGRAAQPLLRLRAGGRQHGRAEGPLRAWRSWCSPAGSRRCRGCRWAPTAARGRWTPTPPTHTGFVPQGIGADLIATLEGFTREDVDTFAVESQTRAAKAWANGYFAQVRRAGQGPQRPADARPRRAHPRGRHAGEPRRAAAVVRDDGRGGRLRRRRAAALPLGREDRPRPPRGQLAPASSTAPRSCSIGTEAAGRRAGLTPRARIVATALSGADPTIMLTGPAPASRKALAKAGLTVDDIDLFEINEAFAAVAMRYMRDMGISAREDQRQRRLDRHGPPARRDRGDDPRHPDRRAGTPRPALRGLATLCVGGGMGIATIVERV